jgi:predicted lipoprotein with Yx(FWY)xxD motif
MAAGGAVAAAIAIAACGGGNGGGAASTPASTVSLRQVSGVGQVLVDRSGMALYTPDQEADGTIRCDSSCTAFWKPLTVAGTPTAADGAGRLGVVSRPDGAKQVTVGGKPLYTFVQDAPGKVTGDGFKDAFGGQRFTWHAVMAGGKPAAQSGGGAGAASGYGRPGGY